jgi:hypothetical protein
MDNSRGKKFKIACLEKALLDYLYLNSNIQSMADFDGLRLNKQQMSSLLDQTTFIKYVKIFDKKSLQNRVNQFMEYLNA